jgi:ABC-2 type transport system ATP-binding protein
VTARPEGAPMLELRGVAKRYGSFEAVKGIDLRAERGEIFGFLGPNGAGKTTTIRMVAGVLRPTSGQVLVGGLDMALEPEAAKAKVGYIPDRPYLYEKLSGGSSCASSRGCGGRAEPRPTAARSASSSSSGSRNGVTSSSRAIRTACGRRS